MMVQNEPLIIGDATLYHGNALGIMRELIDAGFRVHMICSDPPYLLTSGGAPEGGLHERIGGAGYDNGGHLVACDLDWTDFMPLFFEILNDPGHAYVMANNRNVQPMLNASRWKKAKRWEGFNFHNLLVWDKGTATPNRWYMKNCEFTGLFYKGKAFAINDCGSMSCVRLAHTDESKHPTEKPVALMEMYIRNSTKPGDIVFDPFMGSGTTGVAAIKSGRRFVGIELEKEWFDVAAKRIAAAGKHAQSQMF